MHCVESLFRCPSFWSPSLFAAPIAFNRHFAHSTGQAGAMNKKRVDERVIRFSFWNKLGERCDSSFGFSSFPRRERFEPGQPSFDVGIIGESKTGFESLARVRKHD